MAIPESTSEDAEIVTPLPPALQRRVDRAFDKALGSRRGYAPPNKKRKLHHEPSSLGAGGFFPEDAGGFIVEDTLQEAGGFLLDDAIDESTAAGGFLGENEHDATDLATPTHIPLSLIPTALQLLDLSPDDEDIMAVFRNAASGWSGRDSVTHADVGEEQEVSRKDWRAVCAVLLEGAEENLDSLSDDVGVETSEMDDTDAQEQSEIGEDEYLEESENSEEGGSDDEYVDGPRVTRRNVNTKPGRKSRRPLSPLSSDEDGGLKPLTTRQRRECREAFALFFPDVDEQSLDKQKIMIKDIARVAKVLKERLSADEIVEMLEVYSSSPDKSMSLQDFERMMVETRQA